jgi:hypothetical protein
MYELEGLLKNEKFVENEVLFVFPFQYNDASLLLLM